MTAIDWSKAPADAQAYMPASYKWIEGWWKKKGEQFYFWPFALGESGGWSSSYARPFGRRDVVMRPAPQWSGEGLPPVGITCKIPDDMAAGNPFLERFEGKTAHIVAHTTNATGEPLAVFWYEKSDGSRRYHALADNGNFEPIRTPSQIAADEREEAIKELTAGCGSDALRSWAIRAYDDLGYRKGDTK